MSTFTLERSAPRRTILTTLAVIAVLAVTGAGTALLPPRVAIGLGAVIGVALAVALVALSRRDATTVLTVLLVLLYLVPERYVFAGPLKSVGYPAMLVGFSALGLWAAGRLVRLFPTYRGHPLHWLMFAFVLACTVAYAAAMMRSLSPLEASGSSRSIFPRVAMVGIALFACDAIATRRRLDVLLERLVIIAGVAAGVGIGEFFIRSFNYLHYMSLPGLVINGQVGVDIRSSFERVQGAALHPIEYSVAIAAVVPLALHYTVHAATRGRRQIFGVCTVAMVAVLPMSVSRSGVLAVAVGVAVYAVHWNGRARLNALVLGIIGLALFRAAVPGLLGTMRSLFLVGSSDPSIEGRTQDYARIPGLMEGHWLFGRGLGTFQPTQYFFLDNQYLGSLLEGGFLELTALVALFIIGMGLARGARKRSLLPATRSLGQAIAAAIAALAVTAATFDEFSFKQAGFLLFLLLGVAGALWRMAVQNDNRPRPGLRATDRSLAVPGG